MVLPLRSRTCWTLALSGLLATCPHIAGAEALRVIENSCLRLAFDSEEADRLESVMLKSARLRFPQATVNESVVFQDGRTVAISGSAPAKGVAASGRSVTFEAPFPPNPLLGTRPGRRVEFPYFRPDDTALLRLSKTYRLLPDEPACEVRYEVVNTGTEPITFCLRFGRTFGLHKERLKPLLPTIQGVRSVGSGYCYDVPAAWTALVAAGLATVTQYDWRLTSCLHANGAVTTETTLPPGASWSTTTATYFFAGLESLTGLGNGIATDIVFPPPPDVPLGRAKTIEDEMEEATDGDDGGEALPGGLTTVPTRKAFLPDRAISCEVRVVGSRPRKLLLRGHASLNLKSREVALGSREVPVAPGEHSSASFTFIPPAAGTWVLRFEALENGTPVASFERPLVVDYPTGFYLPGLARKREKIGKEFDRYRIERFRRPGTYDQHSIAVEMTEEVQVPHVTCAKPLSGGPLRVLATFPFRRSRDAIEVKLRLATDFDCVLVGAHGYRAPPHLRKKVKEPQPARAPDDEALAMKKALNRKPELILLASTFWDWFLPDIQHEILRQVREDGAALVLYPAQDTTLALEEALSDPETQARIASPKTFFAAGPDSVFPYWRKEDDIEELCHLMVRTARGDPSVAIDWTVADEVAREYPVTLKNRSDRAFRGRLELVTHLHLSETYRKAYLNSPYSHYEETAQVSRPIALRRGERMAMALTLPPLPAGRYRTFLIVKDADGGTVDWLKQAQVSKRRLQVENLRFSPAAGEKLRLSRTDTLRVEFDIAAAEDAPPGDLSAYVRGEDRSQRIVLQGARALRLTDGKAAAVFESPLARALHRLFILRAGVKRGGLIVAEERVPVIVARDPERQDKFRFTLLDNEDSWVFTHVQLDDQVMARDPVPWAWLDMRGYVFGSHFRDPFALPPEVQDRLARAKEYAEFEKTLPKRPKVEIKGKWLDDEEGLDPVDAELKAQDEARPGDEDGNQPGGQDGGEAEPARPEEEERPVYVRVPCYNDPEFREIRSRHACIPARDYSAGWPQGVILVDEYVYGDQNACQCEHCQKAFRKYLQRSYGTLGRLNGEWSTKLKSWDEARLYDLQYEPTPPPRPQWPRAIDTLTYKTVQMVDFSKALRDEAKKVDPEIEFGFSGCYKMDLFNGTEFWLMSQVGKFHFVYRDWEEWSSFVGTPNANSWCSGYGQNYNPSQQRSLPWGVLFRGQWRMGHFTAQGYPMAKPDSRLHPGPKEFFKALNEIHRGYDELLLGHEVRDPVAIHWSGPSFFLSGVRQWAKSGDARRVPNFQRWCTHSVPRMGLRPYYLAHGQLERGELGFWGTPRVIFLQYSCAMSLKECETLRKFVADGGVLVGGADIATRTEHGYPHETPPLDEVFGIRHAGELQEVIEREGNEDHTQDISLTLPGGNEELKFSAYFVGPPNLQATTAQAHGRWGTKERGGPAFLVNRFGKGTAVYLNFPLMSLIPDERTRIGQWILDLGEVKPFATATGCKLSRFRDGDAFYACVQAGYGYPPAYYEQRSKECEVLLEDSRHIYDARHGKYLGETKRFRPDFTAHSDAVYSCLPYRVERVKVQAPPPSRPGGLVRSVTEVDTGGATPVRHVLRVDVIQPDGQRRDILSYNPVTEDGKGTVEIPLALNAPVGRWQLRVRDVATGIEAGVPFAVSE